MSAALPERLREAVEGWRKGALRGDPVAILEAAWPEVLAELAAQQPEQHPKSPPPGRLAEAVLSGRKELRERIVQEWGECCQGGDPACHGPGGCLLIQAMNRPEAQAAAADSWTPLRRLLAAISRVETAAGGDGAELNDALDAVIEAGREVRAVLGGEVER